MNMDYEYMGGCLSDFLFWDWVIVCGHGFSFDTKNENSILLCSLFEFSDVGNSPRALYL